MTRRHLLVFVGALIGILLLDASPASAHGTDGPPASNFHTVLGGLVPKTPGVTVRLGPDREQIELEVSGSARVTVIGYDGEPYLRVSRRGAFENQRSRAVAINRSRVMTSVPIRVRRGPPQWVRVSGDPVVRWHDHRVHWMGGTTPTAVRNDPDHSHVIESWSIPLRIDGRAATITGQLQWQPPPRAWAWWLLAAGIAGAAFVGMRTRRRRMVLTVALAVMALGEVLHLWGSWPFTSGSTADRIAGAIPSLAAIAACVGALVWLGSRGAISAAPGILIAGVFVAVSGGLADLPILSHSWIPSRVDPALARVLVALALGLGAATTMFGIAYLRRPPADVAG